MHRIVPPICLLLSLLLLIAGFSLLARDQPDPSVDLHRARMADDEQYRDLLEEDLRRRRLKRTVMIATLFGMAVVLGVASFVAMRPRHPIAGEHR